MFLVTLMGSNGQPCYLIGQQEARAHDCAAVFPDSLGAQGLLADALRSIAYTAPELMSPGLVDRLAHAKVVSLDEANAERENLGFKPLVPDAIVSNMATAHTSPVGAHHFTDWGGVGWHQSPIVVRKGHPG